MKKLVCILLLLATIFAAGCNRQTETEGKQTTPASQETRFLPSTDQNGGIVLPDDNLEDYYNDTAETAPETDPSEKTPTQTELREETVDLEDAISDEEPQVPSTSAPTQETDDPTFPPIGIVLPDDELD